MSTYSAQLQAEQDAVDRAYGRLDDLRKQTKQRLDAVRAAGSHGSPTQRTERDSFANMYEDRLTQFRSVEDRLVFGRLDHNDGKQQYIGRIGLSSDTHEPIVTDWRAEAARPFYEATPSHHGDITMRRHIGLSMRKVTSIEDEVLDVDSPQVGEAANRGTLSGEGALLASVSSRRTGKMTDIVSTIQAEQDRIIRADLGHATVVQGGPGTGKTAVALHRAAYLLYTHRSTLERSGVLVVGPSSSFLRYIDQVLPSLGETGVLSRTISNLIPGISASAEENPYVAKLKGDHRMSSVIAAAVRGRERVPANLPTVAIEGMKLPMLKSDIEQALMDARRTRQAHNKARETFSRSVIQAMTNRYCEQLEYSPEHDEIARIKSQLRINDKIRKTINLAWLPMQPMWLLDNLWSHPTLLSRYAPWLKPEEVQLLTRPKGSSLTASDIPLLDEAMDLLGPDPKETAALEAKLAREAEERQFAKETLAQHGIGNGLVTAQMLLDNINGLDAQAASQRAADDREWVFGHIVVDEAQELTAMDWKMLIRRCPSHSFTIVGDVAQTSSLGGTRSWGKTMNQLFGPDGWDLNELTIDYRNPREVSQLAAQYAQSEGLHISTVKAVRDVPNAVEHIHASEEQNIIHAAAQKTAQLAQEYISSDGNGRIAVIASKEQISNLTKEVMHAYSSLVGKQKCDYVFTQNEWDRQILITTTQETKGLEFDAVILVDPEQIATEAASRLVAASDIYVAMTRPTQQLVIVKPN